LSRVAPSWFKMEIHWKIQGWETDIAHIKRGWSGTHWTGEEIDCLRQMFPTEDAGVILQALPTRSWRAIKAKAYEKGLARTRRGIKSIPVNNPAYLDMSFEDLVYAEERGLAPSTKNAQWSS
jgi:hypothetical protein